MRQRENALIADLPVLTPKAGGSTLLGRTLRSTNPGPCPCGDGAQIGVPLLTHESARKHWTILVVASSVLTIGRFADGIMVKKWLNRRFLSEYQTDNVLGFGEDAALCGSSSWGCDRCPEYLTAEFTS